MRRYRHILSIIDKCVQANSFVFESNIATTWNPKSQWVVNSISKLYATYCVCVAVVFVVLGTVHHHHHHFRMETQSSGAHTTEYRRSSTAKNCGNCVMIYDANTSIGFNSEVIAN